MGSNNLNPRLTLKRMWWVSNNFAYAAAQGAAKSPGTRYNPLFIYGGGRAGENPSHASGGARHLRRPPRLEHYVYLGRDLWERPDCEFAKQAHSRI